MHYQQIFLRWNRLSDTILFQLNPSATQSTIPILSPDNLWTPYIMILMHKSFPVHILRPNTHTASIHQPEGISRVNTVHLGVDVSLQWTMSLLRSFAEFPAEVGIVTLALGYSGKWYRTRRGTKFWASAKIGASSLVAHVGLDSWNVQEYLYPDYPHLGNRKNWKWGKKWMANEIYGAHTLTIDLTWVYLRIFTEHMAWIQNTWHDMNILWLGIN